MNLKTYIDKQRGRAASLGRAIGVTPVLVSQWANGRRPIPAERCPAIEKATSGEVTCEELRPDVDWAYLRGANTKAKEATDA
ncbi:transcriptional regulator [Pigmentiphaga sp. NML080357]|uniref:transcriptional regulator n=1 Tax=Pigmentiphaga sp. NML080357 TaxID=2008675 RepID=UPI000B40ED1A|nr:helix-turn-helix domain-containing protein [Pigmentiphaga sp. NML080357]OVZ64195.1 transcriptional regulator [Pigmentiphaga sp. NML080357]